jgi:hypothetical protein
MRSVPERDSTKVLWPAHSPMPSSMNPTNDSEYLERVSMSNADLAKMPKLPKINTPVPCPAPHTAPALPPARSLLVCFEGA